MLPCKPPATSRDWLELWSSALRMQESMNVPHMFKPLLLIPIFVTNLGIPFLSGSMDGLLQNSQALTQTVTAFRELIGYYVVSNNPHASELRVHMRRHNHGAFLSSLYQDLCDICAYCEMTQGSESRDESADSDLRGVLICLSSLVSFSNASDVSCCSLAYFGQNGVN